jgi:ketosteroid isomerase-like protein
MWYLAPGRAMRTGAALIVVAMLVGVGALAGCGGGASQTSPSPSATASATPSATATPTPSTVFEPWPPGTASAAQALTVGQEYATRSAAETVGTSTLLATDCTMDIWIADQHFQGAAVVDYMTGSPEVLDWSHSTIFATAGAAAVEQIVTNAESAVTMPCLSVLTISDGKITHLEVYGNGEDGSQVAVPSPVSVMSGPKDDAVAVKDTVGAYFFVLAKGDTAKASTWYSPRVVFQDTTTAGKPGGVEEAKAWHAKLAAVPDMSLDLKSVIAGKGWAVARWVLSGDDSTGASTGVRGATLFEVRGGKIVRQTLYYSFGESPFR